ncbi:hypothetical protein WDC_0825 [Paucilactobacillus wasatchensis]|uniref:Aminotransferase class I/classII large domain-containing protein n=1 Tax=Paucilactobacillus wasatchensis TaxID=1335616 RepID=A0A0D0Y5P3_9LACO|nr:hypothetical protein WDC_0825 [Paucilactobacillus wasatchensis]
MFGAVQDAAVVALESQQESVRALNQLYQERRDTLVTALNQLGWHVAQPQGTFLSGVRYHKAMMVKHLRI